MITVGVMLLFAAVMVVYLLRGRRPVKPRPGALTVDVLRARLAKEAEEIQSQIRDARETEFRKLAEANARCADELVVDDADAGIPAVSEEKTDVLPVVEAGDPSNFGRPVTACPVPEPRRPSRNRPYTGLKPRLRPTPKMKTPA